MDSDICRPDGRRPDPRAALDIAARLHREGELSDVAIVDLAPHGCRVTGAAPLPPGSYVTLALSDTTIIAGRIAWATDDATGIDFCQALRPRALAKAFGLDAAAG